MLLILRSHPIYTPPPRQAAKVRIFVRRGGPNYVKGLELMRQLGAELGLPIAVYGPESSMTGICKEACDYVAASA